MNENEQFFISEAIRHARSLPFGDSLRFLAGFVRALEDRHPAKPAITVAHGQLSACNAQLDLIQLGQLKLEGVL